MSHKAVATLGLSPSFGFGDRLGLATPGHVESLRRTNTGIAPIFAQQSIREMKRTNRTPEQVMGDAVRGALESGYNGIQGADADHLKTPQDVDRTAAAGFCFFTIDPSDHVDTRWELAEPYAALSDDAKWPRRYLDRRIDLPSGTHIVIDEVAVQRASVKYGKAINQALELSQHIDATMSRLGRDYEIELSVDETPQPTTLAEHFMIAEHCLAGGMKLVSLAPRFIGDFEKGVDYKGDLAELERSLADHAAIARMLGPYKLSLHSGSDKLSIYPLFARATQGCFHVKTAGTSYLEALRVVARHDASLFRQIIDFSRAHYETDRATYHVSATLQTVPPPSDLKSNEAVEQCYLERWSDVSGPRGFINPGRQILHTTYGSVLNHPDFGARLFGVLNSHPQTYKSILAEHFARHLDALKRGM